MGSTSSSKHSRLKDFVSWFEIPVYDISRATKFYNAIYNIEMEVGYNGDFAMAYFPAENGIGGALVQGPGCVPNDTGTLIYLNASFDMDNILARIDMVGGRVIMPKTLISDAAGSFALFIDSEGNRMALHEGPTRSSATPAKAAAKKVVAKKAAPRKAVVAKKAKAR